MAFLDELEEAGGGIGGILRAGILRQRGDGFGDELRAATVGGVRGAAGLEVAGKLKGDQAQLHLFDGVVLFGDHVGESSMGTVGVFKGEKSGNRGVCRNPSSFLSSPASCTSQGPAAVIFSFWGAHDHHGLRAGVAEIVFFAEIVQRCESKRRFGGVFGFQCATVMAA